MEQREFDAIRDVIIEVYKGNLPPDDPRFNLMSESLTDLRIEGVNFNILKVTGADFRGTTFVDCRFSENDLSSANFGNCHFEDVTIFACPLVGASFDNARLFNCEIINHPADALEDISFHETTFTNARFQNMTIPRSANFQDAKIDGVKIMLKNVEIDCSPSQLPDCFKPLAELIKCLREEDDDDENDNEEPLSLQQTLNAILDKHEKWLKGEADGEQANFKGEYWEGLDFSKRNLSKINFSTSDVRGSNFDGAIFLAADFRGATVDGASFNNCSFEGGANFSGAYLSGATFNSATLKDADFTGALLCDTSFENSDLEGATFEDLPTFTKTSFKNASLNRCYFGFLDIDDTINVEGAKTLDLTIGSDVGGFFYNGPPKELRSYFDSVLDNSPEGKEKTLEQRREERVAKRLKSKQEKINDILDKHKKWIEGAADGEQITFEFKNLSGIVFKNTNLSEARFYGCNLCDSDFEAATLKKVYFIRGTIHDTPFKGADLTSAFFQGFRTNTPLQFESANLTGAGFDDFVFSNSDAFREAQTQDLNIGSNVVCEDTTFPKELLSYKDKIKFDHDDEP